MLGELNSQQIDQVLNSTLIGRIGCHAEGKTYVVPVTYAYDGERIYGHSREGMKLRMMRLNPEVCFEVEDITDMSNWRSVIAWGNYEQFQGEDAERAMRYLVDRVMPHLTSKTVHPHTDAMTQGDTEADAASAEVFSIRLTEKTGRYEKG